MARRNGTDSGEAEEGTHQSLYDQPLVVEGKRKRKSIEQFSVSYQPKKPKAKVMTMLYYKPTPTCEGYCIGVLYAILAYTVDYAL